MKQNKLFGLVLAGGLSKRMGEDKSEIAYHGLPQYEYVARLLNKFCNEVFISVNRTANKTSAFALLPDSFLSEGPIAGILTALSAFPRVAWLIAPVDMPALDEPTIEFLLSNRSDRYKITCFTDAEGKNPEPLLSVWKAGVLPELLSYYHTGGRSVRSFMEDFGVNLLHAPNPQALVNINTRKQRVDFDKKMQQKNQSLHEFRS